MNEREAKEKELIKINGEIDAITEQLKSFEKLIVENK